MLSFKAMVPEHVHTQADAPNVVVVIVDDVSYE
jgi:hypothetical protein